MLSGDFNTALLMASVQSIFCGGCGGGAGIGKQNLITNYKSSKTKDVSSHSAEDGEWPAA